MINPDTLKKLRTDQDLSKSELARRASISRTYVTDIENGDAKCPSATVVANLAKALGTTSEHLNEGGGKWFKFPMSREARTAAFNNGVKAYQAGQGSCPHRAGGARSQWLHGWHHARDLAKADAS